VWYQNIRSALFSFVTIHASDRQTDRRTERQNCDSNTVHCITCSRTV